MAHYPDRRSAALPALAAAQRVHGWCSPEAIEQVACVMRVTPAYLESVATFYDMLETEPGRAPRDLRLHEHLLLAARRGRAVRGGARPRREDAEESTCARSSASAHATSRRWPPSTASTWARSTPPTCRSCSRTCARGARCCPSKQLARQLSPTRAPTRRSSPSTRRSRRGAAEHTRARRGGQRCSLLHRHRRARPEHARGLRAPRRLRVAAQGAGDDPEEVLDAARSVGSARARRRRLRDGQEGLVPAEGRDGQVPRVQRRRVRAGHLQGPRTDAEDARTC